MKTIISIIEAIIYNLFPADLAAPVVIIMKDILPLLGLFLVRITLHMAIMVQKVQESFTTVHGIENENLQLFVKFEKQE